jgi:hypothetical protein
MKRAMLVWVLAACGTPPLVEPPPVGNTVDPPAPPVDARPSLTNGREVPATPPQPLQVQFLGVQGFIVRYGEEAVMTPPLFTRPSLVDVNVGTAVSSDVTAVTTHLTAPRLEGVRAVLAGHAHYDHILDLPAAQVNVSPPPALLGNMSMKNLFAALAPAPVSGCTQSAPPAIPIDPARIFTFDDPADSTVDYRNCPSLKPAGAPLEGRWVSVPSSHIRVLAICSIHPDQFGPVHFAPGDVDAPQCELPTRMDAWKEGHTLSYLIDFLDPVTHAPLARVYYQDAPGTNPIGYPPADVLAEKRIDLALMCVGNYDVVQNQPTDFLTTVAPRFALGGHWEDFFQPYDQPPQNLPFLDVPKWETLARAAMTAPEPQAMVQNGFAVGDRALLPNPGDTFTVPPP